MKILCEFIVSFVYVGYLRGKKIISFNKTKSSINIESEKNLSKRKAYLILFYA